MKKKILVLMVLGLVAFNSVFSCDIKVGDNWYKDMPCCVAKLSNSCKRCDKLSLKEFNNVNEIRLKISKLYTKLSKCTDDEEKASIKEEVKVLNKELKDITGLSYSEVFNRLKF